MLFNKEVAGSFEEMFHHYSQTIFLFWNGNVVQGRHGLQVYIIGNISFRKADFVHLLALTSVCANLCFSGTIPKTSSPRALVKLTTSMRWFWNALT